MYTQQEEEKFNVDELLDNFELNTTEDWTHWNFKHQQFDHIPLGFSSRYNFYRSAKYCNLTSLTPKQDEVGYTMVEGYAKKKDKDHISKHIKFYDRRQPGNTNIRIMTKKFKKNLKPWHNQIKTNFRKITVRNDWKDLKTINKATLEALPKATDYQVEVLKTIGRVHALEPRVERVSWQSVKFKENKVYEVEPVSTASDPNFQKIVNKLTEKEDSDRFNVICHPNFLFALLTIKGGVYPWNIEIEKDGNNIVLESYKGSEEASELNYLDLFMVNENTTNNMPIDENQIKKTCVTATRVTKVFKDLLASGEPVEMETEPESDIFEKDEDEDEQEEEDTLADLEKLRKYLKISLGNIDIYSYVQVDGVKENKETGEIKEYLIRTFMESETLGAWSQQMKTSPGTIITKEYQSNNCSLQKWICEAKLAGVSSIKAGYMGFEQNKPTLLNVSEITVEGMESILSFKTESCWSVLKYVLDLIAGLDDGTFVLSRAPYTPLSIKLFKIASKEEEEEEENEEPAQ